MKIKELPEMERPYEKLEIYGEETLSMAELMAIIIKTGTKEVTALDIAQELIKEDFENDGITFLKKLSLEELKTKKGIGRVKAIQLKAIAELASRATKPSSIIKKKIFSPEDISKILMLEMKNEKREIMKTVLLDNQNQIIKIVTNAIGASNVNYVEIKEIFKEPIKSSASKIILVHNHPSGDVTPSMPDIKFTQKVYEASLIFGIELADHIVIGERKFSSLKRMKKF
jgi:DNA repair protein RadC